jgi:hypothetical protein
MKKIDMGDLRKLADDNVENKAHLVLKNIFSESNFEPKSLKSDKFLSASSFMLI